MRLELDSESERTPSSTSSISTPHKKSIEIYDDSTIEKRNKCILSIISLSSSSPAEMPFLHESGGENGINLNGNSIRISTSGRRINAPKLNKIQHRDFAAPSSSASIQQKLASRKLQMAKLIGNGGGGSSGGLAALQNYQKQQQRELQQQQQQLQGNMDYSQDEFVSNRRARSNNFTLKETFDLLKIWASQEMQWQMKNNFRNFRVWEAISYSMGQMGHDRTAIQCKNRIQNLTSIFYRIKKSKQDYRSFNFPYYKLIGEILDGKKNGGGGSGNLPSNVAANLSAFVDNGVSPPHTQSSSNPGFAAHMALVEEYQHLINGNPDMYLGQSNAGTTSRNSSGNSNLSSVLSPEVSLSEGNSPIRMDHSRIKNGISKSPPLQNSKPNKASLKIEHQDDVSVTAVEDSSLRSDIEQENDMSDIEEQNHLQNDETDPINESFTPASRNKRTFSNAFNSGGPYNKALMMGMGNYNPAKRARGVSTNSTNSFGQNEDPLGQYLSEMIEIERQFLDLERERAENERHTMMYFMQILQALISPGHTQDDENEGEETENDNTEGEVGPGEDGEEVEGEDQNETGNDESEIHKMISAEINMNETAEESN